MPFGPSPRASDDAARLNAARLVACGSDATYWQQPQSIKSMAISTRHAAMLPSQRSAPVLSGARMPMRRLPLTQTLPVIDGLCKKFAIATTIARWSYRNGRRRSSSSKRDAMSTVAFARMTCPARSSLRRNLAWPPAACSARLSAVRGRGSGSGSGSGNGGMCEVDLQVLSQQAGAASLSGDGCRGGADDGGAARGDPAAALLLGGDGGLRAWVRSLPAEPRPHRRNDG